MSEKNDPIAALVDFTAFMFLIAVVMFVSSSNDVIGDEGSRADVFAVSVTAKASHPISFQLRPEGETQLPPTADFDLSVWLSSDIGGAFQPFSKFSTRYSIDESANQVSIYGLLDEDPPQFAALSFSHIKDMGIIGDNIVLTVDIRSGWRSCSVDWVVGVGVDPGVVIDWGECRKVGGDL